MVAFLLKLQMKLSSVLCVYENVKYIIHFLSLLVFENLCYYEFVLLTMQKV